MSTTYISAELRRVVVARAESLCEYCLIHEDDTFFGCQVDHIISEKHGGPTQADNLAYACLFCNLHKGSDVGSFISGTQTLVRFFNPRIDTGTNTSHWIGTELPSCRARRLARRRRVSLVSTAMSVCWSVKHCKVLDAIPPQQPTGV